MVVYLHDENEASEDEPGSRYELRRKYWTYAFPIIQKAHGEDGSFSNVNPSRDNWINGFFGIGGFYLCCVANFDAARAEVVFGRGNKQENKKTRKQENKKTRMPSIACGSEKEPEHTLTFEKDKIVSGETMDVDFDMVGLFFQYTNGSNETIMPADAISVKAFQNGAELTVMVFTGPKTEGYIQCDTSVQAESSFAARTIRR